MEVPSLRTSLFKGAGSLDAEHVPEIPQAPNAPRRERPQSVRFRSRDEVHFFERHEEDDNLKDREELESRRGSAHLTPTSLQQSPLPNGSYSMMYRFGVAVFLVAVIVPLLQSSSLFGHSSAIPIQGVSGGVIPEEAKARVEIDLERRDDSPTAICFRWAQQTALVNGTLYLYGGEASTTYGQTANTWNNDFLTLDLTKTWVTGQPALSGLPQPSGPPAVALGTLWSSYESLYLYGGEFSWKPPETPVPFATWEYDIASQSWIEHSNPLTSSGQSAPDNDVPVQRAAEGAGANVPALGRGFYFGGHLDQYTTPGWSNQIYREYLQSLLEFTFPGYSNTAISSLSNGQDAGSDGVYRNITEGGSLQSEDGFTKRADGLLIYIPGFGDEGILLALAGGTNVSFTEMNNINVYDIATSSWYTQSTAGAYPKTRVNPCAVAAVAPDGSSINIYMFGGQNLLPYDQQIQYSDMWILTLPAFEWIEVDQSTQSVPYGRSGHSCNVWDGQMIMVGGYLGNQSVTCDSPGIFVFDLSTLQWAGQFTALDAGADNPLNQQPPQVYNSTAAGGLEGSYGYAVPEIVIKIVGGNNTGGATITKPIASPTAGPLATGHPQTYTVTEANGATVTETGAPGSSGSSESKHSGPNIAAIVVGVVCGLLFLVICYLVFCLFLYRKQLQLYKRHVEMSQRQARGEKLPTIPGLWASDSAKSSTDRRREAANGLMLPGEVGSQVGSTQPSQGGSGGQTSSTAVAGTGYQSVRRTSDESGTEDLLAGQQPTFVGVMLNPRRSLRVVNRD